MNPSRWRYLAPAFAALALSAACSKASTDQSSAIPSAAPATTATATAPSAAAPAAPGSAHAQSTTPEAHTEATPGERAAAKATEGGSAPAPTAGGDLVALGADDKAKVIATAGKTVADTDTYTITLSAPDKVAKGAEGVVTLDIKPKKGWHLNKEFPTKLSVTAPAGVAVKNPEQKLTDATTWNDDAGQFTVRFTASAPGAKDFTGKLKFAVCTDTTCDPKKESLAWAVAVE